MNLGSSNEGKGKDLLPAINLSQINTEVKMSAAQTHSACSIQPHVLNQDAAPPCHQPQPKAPSPTRTPKSTATGNKVQGKILIGPQNSLDPAIERAASQCSTIASPRCEQSLGEPSCPSLLPMESMGKLDASIIYSSPWLRDWAYLIAESLFYSVNDSELQKIMMELRNNGLGLIIPPAVVQARTRPEPELNPILLDAIPCQLISVLKMSTNTVNFSHHGHMYEGALILGQGAMSMDAFVTSFMRLGAGVLDYRTMIIPRMQKRDYYQAADSSSSSSDDSMGSVGQNFPECDSLMNFNILVWNARGAASPDFRRVFLDLKYRYKPNVAFVAETRVGGERADSIISSLGFDRHFKVDPMGYACGLWVLWDTSEIKATIQGPTFQEIHAIMEIKIAHFL